MSKSSRTYELEEVIALATAKSNRVGCPEVGLDDYGIVDYISMDVGGAQTVRCYELKISKSDFLSENKKSFVGDFNYYVLPVELWGSVKNYVEKGIGVWLVDKRGNVTCERQASRMECQMPRGRVLGKILRALNREHLKHSEEAWRARQLAKKVSDVGGAELSVGDEVEYKGSLYVVDAIEYERDNTRLKPECVLVAKSPGTSPEAVKLPASVARKSQPTV